MAERRRQARARGRAGDRRCTSDYLRGAFADYIDWLDELKALAGFACTSMEVQDLLAQIVLLNGETSRRQVDPDAEAIKLTATHQAKGSSTTHRLPDWPGRAASSRPSIDPEAGDVEGMAFSTWQVTRATSSISAIEGGDAARRPRRHDADPEPFSRRAFRPELYDR